MMIDHDWHPTPALRWMLGILQQRFVRECSEYREYNGIPRLAKWTEEDWRQVREASQAEVDAARAGMETRPAPEHVAAHDCACRDCVAAETRPVPDDRWIKHSEETSPVPAPRGPCPECKGAGWRDGGFPGYSGICPDCGGSGLNREVTL